MLLHQAYLKPWIIYNTSYSSILRYIKAYLGITLTHLDIFVTVCNLGIFRTLTFSEPFLRKGLNVSEYINCPLLISQLLVISRT